MTPVTRQPLIILFTAMALALALAGCDGDKDDAGYQVRAMVPGEPGGAEEKKPDR